MYLRDIPWHTRCFDRSKEKNWIAMRKPDFYILLRQYKIYINRTDTPPRLLLSLCFCSPQPLCFLCLLGCIWCNSLLLPNHVNTAQELQRRSKKLCSAWDSHTRTHSLQGLQFSNFVFELLNLKATWVQKTQNMLEHWMDLLHLKIIQSNLPKHSFYPT